MIVTWVLILFISASPLSHQQALTLDHIPGFATFEECRDAGHVATSFSRGTGDTVQYVCVKQSHAK